MGLDCITGQSQIEDRGDLRKWEDRMQKKRMKLKGKSQESREQNCDGPVKRKNIHLTKSAEKKGYEEIKADR